MKSLNILGLIIFSVGALVLTVFGLYKFLEAVLKDSTIPVIVRWGIISLILGAFIILTSLIIERIKDKKREPKI